MFEKIDRETREKFKKTEHGKKINKVLYISLILSAFLLITCCIAFFSVGAGNKIISPSTDFWLNTLFVITSISIILTCYFDGKRDGALEQFKRVKKK